MAPQLEDYLMHCKRKLERGTSEEKTLDIIRKLYKVPITVKLLQVTGIGKTVKQLGKQENKVGEKASIVLKKWRDVVSKETALEKDKNSVKHSHFENSVNGCLESSPKGHKSSHSSHKNIKVEDEDDCKEKPVAKKFKSSNGHSSAGDTNYTNCSLVDNSVPYDPENYGLYTGSFAPNIKTEYKPTPIVSKSDGKSEHKKVKLPKEKHFDSKKSIAKSPHVDKTKKSSHVPKQEHSEEKPSKVNSETKKDLSNCDKLLKEKKFSLSEKDTCKKEKLSTDKNSKVAKAKRKVLPQAAEEFTASEASFEDCLGFNDIVKTKKKKLLTKTTTKSISLPPPSSRSVQKAEKPKISKSDQKNKIKLKNEMPSSSHSSRKDLKAVPKDLVKTPKPIDINTVDILSTLPEIQPNYKPLRRIDTEPTLNRKKALSNEEAILFTSSKKDRTHMYSGRRTCFLKDVPSLYGLCIQKIIDNIDDLGSTGGVPYFILKPILERCSPQQLNIIEHFNHYLVEDTDELWEIYCMREFKSKSRKEDESWHDLYQRLHDEKKRKLKSVTANISASMSKSNPVRQVKLAYVDSVVKPPRDIARKQAKHGTGLPVNHSMKSGPPSKATPRPTAPAINAATTTTGGLKVSFRNPPPALKKPKPAPLMAKTLKALKKAYRR